jgi:SAM-dependent methyltransferase
MGLLPYEVLSRYYQKLLYDKDYDCWTEYLLTLVEKYSTEKSGVDVGCGTGIFTRKLKKAGFNVSGVDISQSMLTVAETLTRKDKIKIDYIKGDMRSIALFNKVGFISVVNDGLNYVEGKFVKRTFKSFNKCLLKGGLLIFDLSTEYKLSAVLNGQMYGDDSEDLSYVWLSEYDKTDKKLDINISFFEKQGDVYKRYNEYQTQYAHSVEFIKNELIDCGFDVVSITNQFGKDISEKEERVLFVAIKK